MMKSSVIDCHTNSTGPMNNCQNHLTLYSIAYIPATKVKRVYSLHTIGSNIFVCHAIELRAEFQKVQSYL